MSFIGIVPPSVEEGSLNDCELVLGVGRKLGDNSVDGVLDSGPLDVLPAAVVVFVDGFEPSDIVMRVGDEMDGDVGVGW